MKSICALAVLIVAAGVSISAEADQKDSSQSPRRYINLPKPVPASFSDGVRLGNTLYIAGHLGLSPRLANRLKMLSKKLALFSIPRSSFSPKRG